MNCLSGRRDKAFDPQAMQKVRAACAVLAEDGTYPFDLSVTDPEIYRQVSAWFTDLLRKSLTVPTRKMHLFSTNA